MSASGPWRPSQRPTLQQRLDAVGGLAAVIPIRTPVEIPDDGGCAFAAFDPDLGDVCGRPARHAVHVDDDGGRVVTLFACEYKQHQAYVEDAGNMLRDWLDASPS